MVGVLSLHRTTIGKKVIMAVTGLIWIGFVTFHMYGNLKAFGGPDYFNAYAEGLREIGEPIFGRTHLLWIARLILGAAFLLHVWAFYELYQQNQQSRSTPYVMHTRLQANQAALTMRYGGVAILLFVIYHLLHFTLGAPVIHPDFIWDDAYHNLVTGFQSYFYIPSIIYILAVIVLGFHLYHGTWSMFQTLGLNNKAYTKFIRMVAWVLAIVVPVGFAIVPLSVMAGIIR
jgi:succinate dehydrogenase / fumarate reductase cytochrome b subunit